MVVDPPAIDVVGALIFKPVELNKAVVSAPAPAVRAIVADVSVICDEDSRSAVVSTPVALFAAKVIKPPDWLIPPDVVWTIPAAPGIAPGSVCNVFAALLSDELVIAPVPGFMVIVAPVGFPNESRALNEISLSNTVNSDERFAPSNPDWMVWLAGPESIGIE
jgi:hypothetical protein